MKHLLSDFDLTEEHVDEILTLAIEIKSNPKKFETALKGKILAMVFQKPSTRTNASFQSAAYQMGGNVIYLDNNNSQIGRGESLKETAKILSGYTNFIVARLNHQKDLEEMAEVSKVPVINALTDLYHPCQILADLLTIKEKKGELTGLKLAYFGDGGNNIANSLLIACSKVGMDVVIACPKNEEYSPNNNILQKAKEQSTSTITITSDPLKAAENVDILYTDTWISMGMEKEKEARVTDFKAYQINQAIVNKAKKDCIVMHCLPAYVGYEITEELLHGKQSVVYQQAENRLHVQKALLFWLQKDL
ncbi:MAG: ornithine carbamoyltransferase [Candidatus Micrarchaeota archaeon]|nr:ornithine carbamoyltransferase [Candidatus Micrarchaeota archaeon]